MFSGKTEELIRRMKRAKFAKQKVEIFKPSIDVRYSDEEVVSHDRNTIHSTPIDSSESILLLASDIEVVGIDEAQFFDEGLINVCNTLANNGVRVIIAGLDMDFKGVPLRSYPCAMCHCRRCYKGACYLRKMWCFGIFEPSPRAKQSSCTPRRTRRIRTTLPRLL